ncbi:deoxyuridine 5'-triphosphate nucleotidohydrolase [Burkholderia pseudomallei]|nr:deoxyuridine 5'-triphosphate nucleotidohydrolase [Burkholderia pseudomallei]RIV61686.1 deoxyuridine 5'-triphosphate nucleotidohydrolase [Burkholderia pseudomallei]
MDDRCRARLNFLNEANRSERSFSRHALDSRFMPVKCPKSTVPQGDLLRAYGNA